MSAELRVPGQWWIPGTELAPVPGWLQRDGERLTLHLIGGLASHPSWFEPVLAPVVLGTNGGEQVTLLDCGLMSQRANGPAPTEQTWYINVVVRGVHLKGEDDSAFDLFAAAFDDLAEFMNLTVIEYDLGVKDEGIKEKITIRRVPSIRCSVDVAEYELYSGSTITPGSRDLSYRYQPSFYTTLTASASLEEIRNCHLQPMRYLLSLVTANATGLQTLGLGRRDPADDHSTVPRWDYLDWASQQLDEGTQVTTVGR